MALTITNQKPVELDPVHVAKVTGDFDPVASLERVMVAPLRLELVQGTPVSIEEDGAPLSDGDIAARLVDACGATVDPAAEAWACGLYRRALAYAPPKAAAFQEVFLAQAGEKAGLPFPVPGVVVYTPTQDVVPASREFLAGLCGYDKFFASLGYYARPEALGFYFANSVAFDAFKAWLKAQVANIAASMPVSTNQLFSDFDAGLSLDGLTESLALRNEDGDNNEEYSFARVLVSHLMGYAAQVGQSQFGVLPFDVGELFCPKSVVFVNVEKHANARANEIRDEWDLIRQSAKQRLNIISNRRLTKLTAVARSLRSIQSAAAAAAAQASQPAMRSAAIRLRRKAPTSLDIAKSIRIVLDRMGQVNRSDNSYKSVRTTYAKPNRRDPDDFNKQGKSVNTKYYPDIHLYIDTSGSISEENYQDTVRTCIMLARKLNVNLYVNSFSHCLSQCALLKTRDKTALQVYQEFARLPKVTGGTDYEQIWEYIQRSAKRRRELGVLITDFEYLPPNRALEHPRNLYYVPISKADWPAIQQCAEQFANAMKRIEPNIRRRIIA